MLRSLQVFRERGMTSAGLGVDADNPIGRHGPVHRHRLRDGGPLERLPQADGDGRVIETDRELEQLAAEAPDIPGLRFRRLRLPDDLVALSEMHNRACEADGLDERESPEEWETWFAHPSGFDPMVDCLVGEVDGRIVAYAQARAGTDNDGGRNYVAGGEVDPEYRGRGIGRAVLRHNMRHLRERARREAEDGSGSGDRAAAGELGLRVAGASFAAARLRRVRGRALVLRDAAPEPGRHRRHADARRA